MHFVYRQIKSALVLSVALGFGASAAHAEDTAKQAAARKAIEAQYAVADRSAVNKDLDAFVAIWTPDYQMKMKDGTVMNRAEAEIYCRRIYAEPGLQILSSSTKMDKLEWFGEEAIVWTTTAVQMRLGNASVEGTGTQRDLWHPKDGKWWLKRNVELSSQTKVDGKVMPGG